MEKSPEEYEHELGYTPVYPKQIHPIFSGILASGKETYRACRYELTLEDIANINEQLISEAINNEQAEKVAKSKNSQTKQSASSSPFFGPPGSATKSPPDPTNFASKPSPKNTPKTSDSNSSKISNPLVQGLMSE